MRKGIIVEVTPADRARLQSIIRDRNSPQKHEGLTRDKTRPSRIPPLPAATVDCVDILEGKVIGRCMQRHRPFVP